MNKQGLALDDERAKPRTRSDIVKAVMGHSRSRDAQRKKLAAELHFGPKKSRVLETGWDELDALLPGGGWPLGSITEISCTEQGFGELSLVMPTLARLSQKQRMSIWLSPPHVPYPPALAAAGISLAQVLWIDTKKVDEQLWAAEQALRHPACGAVLLWLNETQSKTLNFDRVFRRLQLAAETGGNWGVVFRPAASAARVSNAALRLQLSPSISPLEALSIEVQVLKCRGRLPGKRQVRLVPAGLAKMQECERLFSSVRK